MSYAEILDTSYGKMIVNRHDTGQVPWLRNTGRAVDATEIDFVTEQLASLSGDAKHVYDVGACFGTNSFAYRNAVGRAGFIYAIEPQRIHFNMLCGSIALNGYDNVIGMNLAIGDRFVYINLPSVDYNQPLNFGGVEFGEDGQKEALAQDIRPGSERAICMPLDLIIDSTGRPPTLVKIDAEGMEDQILTGMVESIKAYKPHIYIEYQKSDKSALFTRLTDLGYAVHERFLNFWCEPV